MDYLRDLQAKAFNNSALHGFWSDSPFGEHRDRVHYNGNKFALIHGEVSEAHEELRKNPDPAHTYYRADGKPEGLPFELADVVIRVMDFAEAYNIDLAPLIEEKMAYNATRPMKHGKEF